MPEAALFSEMKRYALRVLSVVRIVFVLALALALGYWLGRAVPPGDAWTLADLRALDPADQPDPAADLTALYVRRAGLGCELRLDFVDLANPPVYDLSVDVGAQHVRVSSAAPLPAGLEVEADALVDTLTLRIQDCRARGGDPVRVASGPDSIGPVPFDGAVPPGRVWLAFAFYDDFSPAATPAQALRRWDGAHTGPRGERHGLHNLLNAAEQYRIPLTLLDLETPGTLSALDYLGGLQQIRRMQQQGLLVLPAVRYGEPGAVSLGLAGAAARGFGLAPAGWSYDALQPGDGLRSILPASPGDGGLLIDTRRRLLNSAASGGPALIVGGDFQRTTWGTPDYVGPAMAWLAARPYIRFADASALKSAAPAPVVPPDPLERSAFDTRFMLAGADPALAANYAGVVDSLQAASRWAQKPVAGAACARVCILSSGRFYAVLDPRGGRLVFFFAGESQLVGPTAQFFVGFSDRSQWDLSQGEGADPGQVMGAFADADDAFRAYRPERLDAQTIRFTAGAGRVKTYRLSDAGLQVQLSGPVDTRIPLVVEPQARFVAGWADRYVLRRAGDRLGWGLADGPTAWISAPGASGLALVSVFDGRALLLAPEDPNLEYPQGIYLPFPLALVRLDSPAGLTVSLSTSEK